MYFLTIISPFHNSEEKCRRLLNTLLRIDDEGVEIILVDDGSTDNTLTVLSDFKENSQSNVSIITQVNKGPGGARNTGLKVAKGEYVWFVDSDDDIKIEAISYLKSILEKNYDFIDFNIISKDTTLNSMRISPGIYEDIIKNKNILLDGFGRICTKVFKKEFLIKNNIRYPEYCIYEDNPLVFIFPFICNNFLKVDIVGYIHNEEYESVTRSNPSSRFFDRLSTSIHGFKAGCKLTSDINDISILESIFTKLYLINTAGAFFSIYPSKKWILTYRVMKQYRKIAKELNIDSNIRDHLGESKKYKTYFLIQWYVSFLLFKDQTEFFEKERYKAWNKPFTEDSMVSSKL
jgi:glycosyltransferase involved in cell wall biosynthesis